MSPIVFIRSTGAHADTGVAFRRRVWSATVIIVVGWAGIGPVDTVFAGGGPENVFVVVNSRSWASRTVANHFCHLREIPAANVMYLDWKYSVDTVGVELFRKEILNPIFQRIAKRKLTSQIDYIVYSSDFPFAIDVRDDIRPPPKFHYASLTGLTYMADRVRAKERSYFGRALNYYADPSPNSKSRGFRSSRRWALRAGDRGNRYFLSTMLAYTSGRGNSIDEVVDYLTRSVQADRTRPNGTIYFAQNSDIRSSARHDGFAGAVRELQKEGVRAAIVQGTIPRNKPDVQGVMLGTANFNWSSSGCTILPGAICDHFTSYGAVLRENASQTPLTQFLSHGAAGASGTVVEPTAMQAKFPTPRLHVHYARGCSLAEAFFQSVSLPYQLLVVGDPLCQPWATQIRVALSGLKAGASVSGRVVLRPRIMSAPTDELIRFELFVDGRRIASCPPKGQFQLNTRHMAEGYHEAVAVAIVGKNLEMQGRIVVPFSVHNQKQTIDFRVLPSDTAHADQQLTVVAQSPGATKIVIFHDRDAVGTIQGERGSYILDIKSLGHGPVSLQAVATHKEKSNVFSMPITLQIRPPTPIRPVALHGAARPGLRLAFTGGNRSIEDLSNTYWLRDVGMLPNTPFHIEGQWECRSGRVHQFLVGYSGRLTLRINDQRVFDEHAKSFSYYQIPVSLAHGGYRLRIDGSLIDTRRLILEFGGKGTSRRFGRRFRH